MPFVMCAFCCTYEVFLGLLQVKTKEALDEHGGIEGLAGKLDSSLSKGIAAGNDDDSSHDVLDRRREAFGENKFRAADTKSFWKLVYENLQDPTLILLMAAALVRLLTPPSLSQKSF